MLVNAVLSALVNVVVLAGGPFLIYFLWHRLRHGRRLPEVAERAGLRWGDRTYAVQGLLVGLAIAVLILVLPPPMESMTREGSAHAAFHGLGLSGTAVFLAFLYGLVKTGFPEEMLFRGLIAGSLARRLPELGANLLQAVIFLVPHLFLLFIMPELWWLLPLQFAGAMYTGWLRMRSGSIAGPWLVHGLPNAAMGISVAVRTAGGA
jgi:membrane protease YdiL (CAAX protease family)